MKNGIYMIPNFEMTSKNRGSSKFMKTFHFYGLFKDGDKIKGVLLSHYIDPEKFRGVKSGVLKLKDFGLLNGPSTFKNEVYLTDRKGRDLNPDDISCTFVKELSDQDVEEMKKFCTKIVQ